MDITTSDLVAAYAAIVATGAFALEVRRWFETGPKQAIRTQTGMKLVSPGNPAQDEDGLCVVNVSNRGSAPTTVTGLGLLEYPTLSSRLRRKPTRQFMVLHPQLRGHPPAIPKEVPPGTQWTGISRPDPDTTGNIETGNFFVAIYTTERDKPFLRRIPKVKDKSAEISI
ncbi:hypothetical protein [Aureimonas phyllosphaerae]|uniref:Uncharacterized protein n=1 Tax=Aureimonas phyllosphaerae TaxID=1166078 RepID=A0A7W6BXK9_9HYPH|nr:hypothetical protein [Aureimonas phyllosphaerae]MBB3936580.1 hypothetical protein [Aureimonas phyllosphaerae]MBB3960556.1 hypothetical protein [Aureimonas phyllosphaerae]SFF24553.1 hypothetical protein SAMN05216566_105196 [Aureimonas phyllosphaerae]